MVDCPPPDPRLDFGIPFLEAFHTQWQPEPPVRAVAVFAGCEVAEILCQAVVAAHLTRGFPNLKCLGAFVQDEPWKRSVLELSPHIHGLLEAPKEAGGVLPLDWFDIGLQAPVTCPDQAWAEQGWRGAPLVFPPSQLGLAPGRIQELTEFPPLFHLPDGWSPAAFGEAEPVITDAPDLAEAIRAKGVDAALFQGPGRAGLAQVACAKAVISRSPDLLCLGQAFQKPVGSWGLTDPLDLLWWRGAVHSVSGNAAAVIDYLLADERRGIIPAEAPLAARRHLTYPLRRTTQAIYRELG